MPSDNMKDIQLGVNFTLSQSPVGTFPTPCDHRLWEMVLEAGENFQPIDVEEQKEAIQYAKENGFSPLYPE